MHELAILALGAALALDGTSVGQFMVSRPLVGATLAGLIVGDPATAFTCGLALELFYLPVFAVGGSRFPESGPAAVVAGAAAAWGGGAQGVALGVLLGLILGEVGGFSISLLRRLNSRLVPVPEGGPVTAGLVVRSHFAGIGLDLARGIAVTGLGLAVSLGAIAWMPSQWPLSADSTAGLVVAGVSVPLGMLLRGVGGWKKRRSMFVVGLAGGVVLGLAF